jgi:hypothetical protein
MEEKLKKVCFFGASVTRQPKGMVHLFQELNQHTDTYFFAYGGTRIKDAGVCHLNKVVSSLPDYCFIDWFSGQMPLAPTNEFLEMCMDAIVGKLLQKNCVPVFLLMYRYDSKQVNEILPKRKEVYSFVETYCEKYGIPYIPLYKEESILNLQSEGKLLIDVVHTTPDGSRAYAEVISNYFRRLDSNVIKKIISPPMNYLYEIKEMPFEKIINKSLKIIGNGRLMGLNLNAGPHSGVVNLKHSNGSQEKINTWDMYCYYTRNIVSFINTSLQDWVELTVSNENFDKSACSQPCEWEKFEKAIKCVSIFYTGEILDIQY